MMRSWKLATMVAGGLLGIGGLATADPPKPKTPPSVFVPPVVKPPVPPSSSQPQPPNYATKPAETTVEVRRYTDAQGKAWVVTRRTIWVWDGYKWVPKTIDQTHAGQPQLLGNQPAQILDQLIPPQKPQGQPAQPIYYPPQQPQQIVFPTTTQPQIIYPPQPQIIYPAQPQIVYPPQPEIIYPPQPITIDPQPPIYIPQPIPTPFPPAP